MFLRRHSFAGLVSIKSWPKCWKPVESLLGTSKMIAKRQTTGVSFHRVCEAVNNLREAVVYFAVKRMKNSQIFERRLDLNVLL